MFYVISYDITNDKRRRLVSNYLEAYGIRVQYSVFESEINKTQVEILKKGLKKIINKNEDTIRIYNICGECRKKIETLGLNKGEFYDKEYLIY